jgi:hypothetical protein
VSGISFFARWTAPLLVGSAMLGCSDPTTAPRAAPVPHSTVIAPLTCTGTLGDTPTLSCRPLEGSMQGQLQDDGTIIVITNNGPVLRLTIPSVTVTQGALITFAVNWSITNLGTLALGCTFAVTCAFNIPDGIIGNRIFIIAGPFNENGGLNPGINNKTGITTIGPYPNVPYWQFNAVIQPGTSSNPTIKPMAFNLFLPGQIPRFTMEVGLEVVNQAGS